MSQELSPKVILSQSGSVAFRRIEDEILLVPIRTDARQKLGIYTMNKTAAAVWELLDGKRNLKELVRAFCERFDVAENLAFRDIETCCRELLQAGVIEVSHPELPETS